MKYELWTQKAYDPAAAKVHEMAGCKTVWYAPCGSYTCSHCYEDETMYRLCPGCGDQLLESLESDIVELPYRCTCGTVIWICGIGQNRVVTAYALSGFEIKEDII